MKKFFPPLVALTACLCFAQSAILPAPPPTHREDFREEVHGVTIADPYRWLEDQNSAETRAWITAQNAYTHSLLERQVGSQHLQQRLTELMKFENVQSPIERNGRFFYRKRLADQDLYVIYMREGDNGKEHVLVDPHPMSADHSANVDIMDVSKDGKVLAYLIRSGGTDEFEIHLLDVDRRIDLPDRLPARLYFDLSLLPDRGGFYYSMMLDDGPRVRFHKMGSNVVSDDDVFGKGYNKDTIVIGDASEDGRHLVIQVQHGSAADKTEIWLQDLATKGPIKPLVKDIDARFFAFPAGDQLFLHTNWKAPHGRVLAVDFAHPEQEHWQEVVPETDTAIDNVVLGGGQLLVSYVKNASSQVKAYSPDGKQAREISVPPLGSTFDIQSKWENPNAYISYDSFATPLTVYRYEVASGKQSVWSHARVPVDSSKFEVKQVWYSSKDGTRIPMFLVYGKGIKLDGSNPVLLTAYGGFAINMTPSFSPDAVLWIEHGGVLAKSNVRGGGEFGEAWHRAGMLDKKQNVFDDFIAAGEWLIQNKYTQPSRLAIWGGSNGGLLVGAALTQRPELYRAVVCGYPLLDMLRYDKFMEAQLWVSEYGSATDAEQFKWLYAYSPYHHVKPGGQYPAVLFMTGDADTRVAPLHARKMAALLQASSASGRPVLIRYELMAGHSPGRSVAQRIDDSTDMFRFLCWQLGVAP
jgi:prolyl oligopeptidase